MIINIYIFLYIMFIKFPKYELLNSYYLKHNFKRRSIQNMMMNTLANQNEKLDNSKTKQVIVISGATAVGKSSVAMELCKRINGEIVIADSVQIYKYLDIGSNKPTLEEQALVKHHLIDVSDPQALLTTGDYCRLAHDVIIDICQRDKIPVIVGGATMWIDWLVKGFPNAPKATEKTIQYVNELISTHESNHDWETAFQILFKYDQNAANKLLPHKNDWYRLRRYLETSIELNKDYNSSINEYKRSERLHLDQNAPRVPVITEYDIDFRTFFITEDRQQLYQTIDRRCQDMLQGGLLEEVYSLLINEIITPSNPLSKAIGYRQTIQYLSNSNIKPQDMNSFIDYLKNFSTATRNYAQRQIKWHRKDKDFLFLSMKRGNPKQLVKTSIDNIVNEVIHWTNVTTEVYRNVISTQIETSILLNNVKNLKQIPFEYEIKNNTHRLILAVLLYEQNLLELPLKDNMTIDQIPSWMVDIYDVSKGITPQDIETYQVEWTAEELDIRISEDQNASLKGYISKILDPKLKQHNYYPTIIDQVDKLRDKILKEKPKLMKSFQIEETQEFANKDII